MRALYGLAIAIAFAACASPARADISSAQRAYEAVLRSMLSMPEPAHVSYRAIITARNGSFLIGRSVQSSDAQFGFAIGGQPQTLDVNVDESAGRWGSTITLDAPAFTAHPLLDATWRGAYGWLRYGFDGPPQAPSAAPSPAATETPASDPDARFQPVVAVVRAIGTAAYSVEDRGPEPCPDGRPGYHVRLHARRDPDSHPATDATFDPVRHQICMLRFELRPAQFLNVPGSVQIEYAPFGAYVLATQAHIEFWGTIHHVGRNHLEIFAQYRDVVVR